jgi:hypothetical protein
MADQEKKPEQKRYSVQVLPGLMVENIDFPAEVKDETKPAGSVRVSPGTLELTEAELQWLRSNRPDIGRMLVANELTQPAKAAPEAKPEAPAKDEAPKDAPEGSDDTKVPEDKGTQPQRKNRP